MSADQFKIRRATTDDVPRLKDLWNFSRLPAEDLEKRFTEFQLIEGADGALLGAIGIKVLGKHGKIHSEAYHDFGQADVLRPLLWERLQKVFANHGLVRLWTQEEAPFWKQMNFIPADAEIIAGLPLPFGDPQSNWLTLKLREDLDEVDAIKGVEDEFLLFMRQEQAKTQDLLGQAKVARGIVVVISVIFTVLILSAVVYMVMRSRTQGH